VRAAAFAGARAGAALGVRAWGRDAGNGLGLPGRCAAGRAIEGAAIEERRSELRCAWTHTGASRELGQMNEQGPSVLTMIGAVALIVALVILVFFAAGYGFGRLFL